MVAAPPASAALRAGRSALIVFAPAGEQAMARAPGLSVGIASASQGRPTRAQLLLDISQGARVASASYSTSAPPPLTVRAAAEGAVVEGWAAARSRARAAPQLLVPGLLAGAVPGGGAYAGAGAQPGLGALVAADPAGHVARVSLGTAATLPARIATLLGRGGLVVADLAGGGAGRAELAQLAAARAPGELLLVVQRPPGGAGHRLLWAAAGGLPGGGGHELTSASTQQDGLISAVDIAPTALAWLGRPVPSQMRGRELEASSALQGGHLRTLIGRLRVIGARRLPALGVLLASWALLMLLAAPWPAARGRAARAGAVGLLWAPLAALVPAALAPSAAAEYALIALLCLGLGALTDVLLQWPRAVLAPALAVPLALCVDALAHGQLLMRSLLGPDPALGARFYGFGNELKSGLAVLVLGGVAAALYPGSRGRRAVASTIAAGGALALIEGSARIGAAVGGVILVCVGFAVAAVMLAPGALTRRRAAIAVLAPLAGLVALAALDIATAHGSGHFTGSILDARSAGDLRDVLVRRYEAAWEELHNHAMPAATALAIAAAAAGLRWQRRLLASVHEDPVWRAAFAGGLAAGVSGALVEDSGPVLLVVAVFALGCLAAYLRFPPRRPRPASAPAPGPPAARARPPAQVR